MAKVDSTGILVCRLRRREPGEGEPFPRPAFGHFAFDRVPELLSTAFPFRCAPRHSYAAQRSPKTNPASICPTTLSRLHLYSWHLSAETFHVHFRPIYLFLRIPMLSLAKPEPASWRNPGASAAFSFPEHKEIRVIFTGMNLFHGAAHAGPVVPHHDEQVFRDKSRLLVRLHDFDVSEPLAVRANLVLTLHDENAARAIPGAPPVRLPDTDPAPPHGTFYPSRCPIHCCGSDLRKAYASGVPFLPASACREDRAQRNRSPRPHRAGCGNRPRPGYRWRASRNDHRECDARKHPFRKLHRPQYFPALHRVREPLGTHSHCLLHKHLKPNHSLLPRFACAVCSRHQLPVPGSFSVHFLAR